MPAVRLGWSRLKYKGCLVAASGVACLAAVILARVLEWLAGARLISVGGLRTNLLRSALHASLYGAVLCLSLRPWSALAVLAAALVALLAAGKAKQAVLGEQLVFSDLALVGQALRHPGLYYISPLRHPLPWIAATTAIGSAGVMLAFESPLPIASTLPVPVLAFSLLAISGAATGAGTIAQLLELAPDFGSRQYGLLTTLFMQWRGWKAQPRISSLLQQAPDAIAPADCDIVVLQLESFIDAPARGYPTAPLANWPALKGQAVFHGQLLVDAVGANTVRTEFSVLTGLAPSLLGFDRFNPYLRADAYSEAAWATRLRQSGWNTFFIHPNDRRFFARDRVTTALGFDQFWALERFEGANRSGPHVSDEALADKVLECLSESIDPAFVFAVTMENHGPWNIPRLGPDIAPVDAYLAHLRNCDRAVARLVGALMQRQRRALIVLYGDHIPALVSLGPAVYSTATDYIVIDTARHAGKELPPRCMAPQDLLADVIRWIGQTQTQTLKSRQGA